MEASSRKPDSDFYHRLKWLMFFRVLFASLLLGSTIILQLGETSSAMAKPFLFLYGLIGVIFLLSFIYSILINRISRSVLFAYSQVFIDTIVISLIIFMTGGFSSLFSFLYLVVIIYASMLLFKKGSMVTAALCSIQYGIMVDLEFFGMIQPLGMEGSISAMYYPWNHVIYKIMMIMVACFAVAFLSSLLSEQESRSKKELFAMEEHVKRVEKMAAVGEMAAGLAHEIKNPIASLRGAIQILREDIELDADHDRLMQIVMREADRLSSLVSNFLLFAKPPAGKSQKINLSKALADTVELFEKNGSCRNRIAIHKNLVPEMWIEMDPVHLHQIFWNLLLNSAEAIEGKGTIGIELYPVRPKLAVVRITDSGCGIPKEMMRTIFDPFVTTKQNGTGLGLSIVHRIVESYNDWMDVESEKGRGTTFTLNFKRIEPPTKT